MAGVVPFPGRTPGRKQWNIRDRKSMRRLRSQLAEDGCPESQLVLAKQLLEEKSAVDVVDNEENARLGVFWLIKASEQGNVEATNILKKCLETGEGITEHNYLDVKTCLSTLQNEKLAKRAAREMFISLSDGQDFITSEQLRRRMCRTNTYETPSTSGEHKIKQSSQRTANGNSVNNFLQSNTHGGGDTSRTDEEDDDDEDDEDDYDDSLDGPRCGWAERGENIGEKLTEDHLESAATTYSKGELPLVHRVLALSDPANRELQNLNYLQKALLHPVLTIQHIYTRFLDRFSTRHRYNFVPDFSQLQIVLVVLCYPLINFENLFLFIPWFCYYASFFLMVFSTFYMLQSKREYSNFRVWSRLFLSYDRDGNLNTSDAEFEYCKKNLRPYGLFFLCLLVNLVVYPFVSELWIPQSEFAMLSFVLTFLTLYSFHEKSSSKRIDFLVLLSFGINVLAKYPYETDAVVRQTWRFLDIELPNLQSYGLPCFASYVVGNGVEFCLNFRAVFYLLMPGIFLKLASRENWRGTYKVLIPHCVTLSWWQIAVLCCQGATLYGLLRSALALVGFILFLPLVGLATLVLPVVAVVKHFTDAAFNLRTFLTTLLAVIPLVFGYFLNKRRGVQFGAYFSKVQIFLAIIAAVFLIAPSVNHYLTELNETNRENEMQVENTLSWDQYWNLCQRASWDKSNTASTQIECYHLNGLTVNWEGVVDNIQIVSIHNPIAKIIDNFPDLVRNKLTCLYGEKYSEECSENLDEGRKQTCLVLKQVRPRNKKCHLETWSKYEFEILLKIKSSNWNAVESSITLSLDDSLKNFTVNLKRKDNIWFSGTLSHPETIGSNNLKITVDELGCISCQDGELTNMKRLKNKFTLDQLFKLSYDGLKYVLNFLFNPLVIFK